LHFYPIASAAGAVELLSQEGSEMRCLAVLICIAASVPLRADLLVSRGSFGVDGYTDEGVFLGTLIAPGAGGLSEARGVAVAPNGDLLVGDFLNDRILRFTANGVFLNVFSSDAAVDSPFDVVIGTGGDVFVASAGPTSNIARLDANTGLVITPSFTSGNVTPVGVPQYLEFGPALALTDVAGHLFRFDPITGAHISTGTFDNPEGVAYNAAGDLFLAQRISDNIIKIPAGGGPAEVIIPSGTFPESPLDIEFGPTGLLYVSADAIYRFDVSGPTGVLVDSFGTGGEFLVFTAIPEPGAWALTSASVVLLAIFRRRRR
jgi:DNA-binding beta-propeller fold protein YncE